MVQTVISINSNPFSGGEQKPMTEREYKNELKEIIALTNQAKKRLVDLTEETDVDDKAADSLEEALDSLDDAVDLMLVGEDFAFYRQYVPGFFFWIGSRMAGVDIHELHTPQFYADDSAIEYAAELYAACAVR